MLLMIMRILLIAWTISLAVGCSTKREKTPIHASEMQPAEAEYEALSENHLGFWVRGGYYQALRKTKSTKKAGKIGADDFYKINEDHSIMRMNLHEGWAEGIILLTTKGSGKIHSQDTSQVYHEVEFRNGMMVIDGKKYIKAPNEPDGLNQVVNGAFISGKYWLDNIGVEFKESGDIIGLDSLISFKLNLDYSDAGMQLDKIYLRFKNKVNSVPYTYAINADTLLISKINCKTLEGDFCVEIESGETTYTLIKNPAH